MYIYDLVEGGGWGKGGSYYDVVILGFEDVGREGGREGTG